MVYIYAAELTNLPDPKEFPELMKGLPEVRKQKILNYKQEKSRKQSLGASLLLRCVLQNHGARIEDIRIGANGKPELDGICFNLSHSHDWAVCVVSGKPVGCDVEKIENASMRIAERYFCKKEIQHLEKFEGEEKKREFYRLWTMKESYIKMTGEGMSIPLNQFEFVFEEDVKVLRDGDICKCHIKEYEVPGYMLTVCGQEDAFVEKIKYVRVHKE